MLRLLTTNQFTRNSIQHSNKLSVFSFFLEPIVSNCSLLLCALVKHSKLLTQVLKKLMRSFFFLTYYTSLTWKMYLLSLEVSSLLCEVGNRWPLSMVFFKNDAGLSSIFVSCTLCKYDKIYSFQTYSYFLFGYENLFTIITVGIIFSLSPISPFYLRLRVLLVWGYLPNHFIDYDINEALLNHLITF